MCTRMCEDGMEYKPVGVWAGRTVAEIGNGTGIGIGNVAGGLFRKKEEDRRARQAHLGGCRGLFF